MTESPSRKATATGGRGATARHIPPTLALAVGRPACPAPAGWRWRSLDELARMESGHTPSRRHPEYWGGTIPWISIRDAKANHGREIRDTLEKTNELGIANSSARILPKGTVCLSRTASVGYVVVTPKPMATSQDFVNWICGEELEPRFLQYLLIAEGRDLLRFASGAVHQTIYFPEAKAFYICVPSRSEQIRLIALLDEAFDAISKARASVEKNQQNIHALFESQLDTFFLERGEGWIKTKLGAATGGVCTGPFGSLLHKQDYIEGGIPLINPAHITKVGINPDFRKTISQVTASRLSSYIMREGDIVFARRGEMGRCALVTKVEEGWICGTGSFVIKRSKLCNPSYLVRFLRSKTCKSKLEKIAGGAVMPNLSNTDLSNLQLQLPSIQQQEAIVLAIDDLHAETQRLESIYKKKLAALDELKQSLLHQAFSGQL